MTIEKVNIEVPESAASAGSVVCAQCEHEPHASTTTPSVLRGLLGLRQRPQSCAVLEHDSSGWGAHPCLCDDPIHS